MGTLWIVLFCLLVVATGILLFMVFRLWNLYFDLLEYHERFLEKTNQVLGETEKYLEIPIFEFTPEVVAWVTLVKGYRDSMRDVLKGFEVVVEVEETQSDEQV
jgi:hypothetical protein